MYGPGHWRDCTVADVRWVGAALSRAQVNTITPANVGVGNVFNVIINGKTISFTATAATVANVTAGLTALLQAATDGEFAELTWADITTAITATAKTAGKPFTQTSSASGGTATLITATTTANSSPNDINAGANWSGGTVPVSSDNVFVDNTDVSLVYNLSSLSGITLSSLTIASSFTGDIGLPERTGAAGSASSYTEYRPQFLAVGSTTITIGDTLGNNGSALIKINTGVVATTINVISTGTSRDPERAAAIWKGTHAANVLNVAGGSIDVAIFGGETAVIATLRMDQSQGSTVVRCSAGTTLTTIDKHDGDLTIGSAVATSLTNLTGNVVINGSGAIAQLTVRGGNVAYNSTGTLGGTTVVSGDGVLDFSQDPRTKTVTNPVDLFGTSARIVDSAKVVTTLVVDFNEGAAETQVDWGTNVRLSRGTPA